MDVLQKHFALVFRSVVGDWVGFFVSHKTRKWEKEQKVLFPLEKKKRESIVSNISRADEIFKPANKLKKNNEKEKKNDIV